MAELPFGILRPPNVSNTKAALVDIDDHLGKSSVMVDTWWNGEGLTVTIFDGDEERSLPFTHTQWEAAVLAARAISDG